FFQLGSASLCPIGGKRIYNVLPIVEITVNTMFYRYDRRVEPFPGYVARPMRFIRIVVQFRVVGRIGSKRVKNRGNDIKGIFESRFNKWQGRFTVGGTNKL